MRVTNVSVSYGRERQPAKYESSEARVGFDAAIGDNDNYVDVAKQLLGDAKTLVLTEVGIVGAGENASAFARTQDGGTTNITNQVNGQQAQTPSATPPAATTTATDDGKKAGGRKKKDEPTSKDDGTGLPTETPKNAENPKNGEKPAAKVSEDPTGFGDTPAPVKPATPPAASSDGTGAPPAKTASNTALTASDVQALITDLVTNRKIIPAKVKEILTTEFKAARLVDLSPEQLVQFRDALNNAAKAA